MAIELERGDVNTRYSSRPQKTERRLVALAAHLHDDTHECTSECLALLLCGLALSTRSHGFSEGSTAPTSVCDRSECWLRGKPMCIATWLDIVGNGSSHFANV